MKIRIKYQNGQWWAYFNGHGNSWFHSTQLKDMCKAISVMWPRKEHAAPNNVNPSDIGG